MLPNDYSIIYLMFVELYSCLYRIVSLQDILSPLSAIGTKQQSIIVQRRFFLSSVLRAVQKGNFDFRKPLYVIFSGEEAEDHGGPRREFFK